MFIRIYLRDRGTASEIGLDEQSAGGVDHSLDLVLNFVWSPAVPVTFSQRPDCPHRSVRAGQSGQMCQRLAPARKVATM
jgi:hypothetical protein